jgi:hypothetical protein
MVDNSSMYMSGRQKYGRPQGMLFANNPGLIDEVSGKVRPVGEEFEDFIILSDDNRQPISFDVERIENRKRMINGRQRSYHVADKLTISTSWQMLCSRSFNSDPDFSVTGGPAIAKKDIFTSDSGAGGVELLKWYNENPGSFWVYLAYDNYDNFSDDKYNKLNEYNDVIEVFFSDFSYSVEKRGSSNHDYWNVDISLEEV